MDDLQTILDQPEVEMLRLQIQSRLGIVPYVGAGLSVPFDVPSWGDFLASLCPTGEAADEVGELIAAGQFLEAATTVENALGQRRFSEAFRNTFYDRELFRPTNETVVELLPRFAPDFVLTTNYDRVIESAFEEAGRPFEKIYLGTSSDAIIDDVQTSRRVLLKVHGDMGDTVNRITTRAEYRRGYELSQHGYNHTQLLKRLLQSRTVLFLGSSIVNDPIFDILKELSEGSPSFSHYAILSEPATGTEKGTIGAKLQEARVRVIWYPKGRHELLIAIVKHLILGGNPAIANTRLPLEWPSQYQLMEFGGPSQPVFNHDWDMVGREKEITDIEEWGASVTQPIGHLKGVGGIGKSKLLHEFAIRSEQQSGLGSVRFATEYGWTMDRGPTLRDGINIIIIDDAHRFPLLRNILAFARANSPRVKVLLSYRPMAESRIDEDLHHAGFVDEFEQYRFGELHPLSVHHTRALLAQELTHWSAEDLQRLAEMTRDSPLIAGLAARLLRLDGIVPALLPNHQNFHRHMMVRFRDEITGNLPSDYPQALVKRILRVIAATSPLRIRNTVVVEKISQFVDDEVETVLRIVDDLCLAGVLRRRGGLIEIAPDVLSDFVLQDACFTSADTDTGFTDDVFDVFGDQCFDEIMVNLSLLDWRIQSGGDTARSLMSNIWASISQKLSVSSLSERSRFIDSLGSLVTIQPQPIRELIRSQITFWRETASIAEQRTIEFHRYSDALSQTLAHLFVQPTGSVEELDLLFEIGANDLRLLPQNPNHALRLLEELAGYGVRKPYVTSTKVVDWLEIRLSQPDYVGREHLLIPLVEAALTRSGQSGRSSGNTYYLEPYVVSRTSTQDTREKSLSLLRNAIHSSDVQVRAKAAKVLANVSNPFWSAQQFHGDPSEWLEDWKPESDLALSMLEEYVTRESESIPKLNAINFIIRSSLHEAGLGDDRLLHLVRHIQPIEMMALAIASHEWGELTTKILGRDPLNYNGESNLDSLVETIIKDTTDSDVSASVDEIKAACSLLSENGVDYWYSDFWGCLAERHTSVLIEVVRDLCLNDASLFGPAANVILGRLHRRDPQTCHQIVQDAISRERLNYRFISSWWRICSDKVHPEDEAIVDHILATGDHDTIWWLLQSSSSIVSSEPKIVKAMIRETEVLKEQTMTLALFEIIDLALERHENLFSTEELQSLLTRAEELLSWNDYHCQRFLGRFFKDDPLIVTQMVIDRVKRWTNDYDPSFDPFPHFHGRDIFSQVDADENLSSALALIRDSVDPDCWAHQFWFGPAFSAMSNLNEAKAIEVLDDFWRSGNRDKVRVASQLFSSLRKSIVFERYDLISEYLNAASTFGEQTLREVQGALLGQITAGTRSRKPGTFQGYPEDMENLQRAREVLTDLSPETLVAKFFELVVRTSEENIRREIDSDQEEFPELIDYSAP